MKKIVYIVFGIFILGIIMENISFVYAQNEMFDDPIDTEEYGIIRIKDPNNAGKGITILDRNLGATATGAGVDESGESFGYYYQWGNNYGFSSDSNATIITDNSPVDASEYGPDTENGYYSSDTFIIWNSDWSNVRNNNLRGGANDSQSNNRGLDLNNQKDRQGPCPDNYHVPSIGERNKLLEFWAEEYGKLSLEIESNGLYKFQNNPVAVNSFNQRFYLTFAGQRDNNSYVINTMGRVLLRSSSPASSIYAFRLYGNANNIFAQDSDCRAFAFPVRCFFDSYRLPVKITYDVNGGYWIDEENEFLQKVITYTKDDDSEFSGDIALGKVKKDNCGDGDKMCMFGGWYTLTGDKLWTGNISEDITLYAKWLAYEDKYISLSGVNFNVMDRNLGSENTGTGEEAYGYYLTGGEDGILCPEGYHIPNVGEWIGIENLLGKDFSSILIQDLLNLPFAGMIKDNAIVDGENGYYLAKNGDEIMYAKISNNGIEIGNLNEGEKVSARCFKDNNTGTIKFHSEGGNEIAEIEAVNWREEGEDLQIPERNNSTFLGWFDENNIQINKNINYKNEEEINLYAKWECKEGYQENGNKCEEISKQSGGSGGGSSGGGGRGTSKNSVVQGGDNGSEQSATGYVNVAAKDGSSTEDLELQNSISKKSGDIAKGSSFKNSELQGDFTKEFIDAYNFAYKNGITTKSSIYDAKMYSSLTRIQMAKMLSNYAINILGKKPDVSKGMIKFDDVSNKLNKEYGDAVILAYQLGVMGQNVKNNKFRPYDEVTRAEFATALSRLLYGTEDGKNKYYESHISKLYSEGIISSTNPTLKEKRGYVMIMLLRYTQ